MDENTSDRRKRTKRYEVEECVVLSASWMLQNSYFGLTIGQQITRKVIWQTWTWQPLYTAHITLTRKADDEMQMSLDETGQRVELRPTLLRFGGIRWWFHCPKCLKRCVKLYKPPDSVFRCRQCHNLTYQSCNRSSQPVATTGGELMNASIMEANRHWRRKRDRWEGDPDRITWFNKIFGDRITCPTTIERS